MSASARFFDGSDDHCAHAEEASVRPKTSATTYGKPFLMNSPHRFARETALEAETRRYSPAGQEVNAEPIWGEPPLPNRRLLMTTSHSDSREKLTRCRTPQKNEKGQLTCCPPFSKFEQPLYGSGTLAKSTSCTRTPPTERRPSVQVT